MLRLATVSRWTRVVAAIMLSFNWDGAEDSTAAEAGSAETLPHGGIDLKNHMSAIEIGLIRKALRDADGTVAGAARLLNIRRTTLVEKLRKYHLSA